MQPNPIDLLQPVFEFVEGLINDYGDILFMVLVYAAIPFLAWVLSGGLRRKFLAAKRGTSVPPVVLIYLPLGLSRLPPEPNPPLIGQDYEPHYCEFDGDRS